MKEIKTTVSANCELVQIFYVEDEIVNQLNNMMNDELYENEELQLVIYNFLIDNNIGGYLESSNIINENAFYLNNINFKNY
jgi:hypothetical protein